MKKKSWTGLNISELSTSYKQPKSKENLKLERDLTWIDQLDYSNKLKETLFQLASTKQIEGHHYIGHFDGAGHPKIKNELSYRAASFEDVGFRLLGLFRYWNIIQYFSPYRYLIDTSWEEKLGEFIPIFYTSQYSSGRGQRPFTSILKYSGRSCLRRTFGSLQIFCLR